ncbi:hypothetical protein ACQY0O_000586 [Thecaphora frezii]
MPALRSFVRYDATHPFPLENLPYGVFSTPTDRRPRPCVAIGDYVLDLYALSLSPLMAQSMLPNPSELFSGSSLNRLVARPPPEWKTLRQFLQRLLAQGSPLEHDHEMRSRLLVEREEAILHMPIEVGDYTDFYSSLEHATNCGLLFRGKEQALQRNWRWLPVGYHGRASSIVVSGTPFHRPCGQILPDPSAETPVFAPCQKLDYELEIGFVYGGPATAPGQRLTPSEARSRLFGCLLLNDWSARDIQAWEYIPLGPFTSKNFCTTVSPWLVPCLALEPFTAPQYHHQPALLPYLDDPQGRNFDIQLHVDIHPHEAKAQGREVWTTVAKSNAKHSYFTPAQMLAHHTVTGCSMRPGDLLGTGTLSAPGEEGYGSLLEKSQGGKRPFSLALRVAQADGGKVEQGAQDTAHPHEKVQRTFLQDGDSVRMTAVAQGDGFRIGFGECVGTVLPPLP